MSADDGSFYGNTKNVFYPLLSRPQMAEVLRIASSVKGVFRGINTVDPRDTLQSLKKVTVAECAANTIFGPPYSARPIL